jgi:uncharacterized damage-inducible protein DinB
LRLPDDAFGREPSGEWGAARILRHLVWVEHYWTLMLRELLRSSDGHIEIGGASHLEAAREASRLAGTPPEPQPYPTKREALRGLDAARKELTTAVRSLRAADFERRFYHPRMGTMPLRFAIEHIIEHDWDHAVQVAALRP